MVGVAGVGGKWPVRAPGSPRGHPPVKSGRIRWRPGSCRSRAVLAPGHAAARAGPRARGSPAHGAHHAVRRAEERHPGYHDEATYMRDPAPPIGGGRRLRARPPTTPSGPGTSPSHRRLLGGQSAEDPAARELDQDPGPPAGRAADPGRRHRRHRVHSPTIGRARGRGQGAPAGRSSWTRSSRSPTASS